MKVLFVRFVVVLAIAFAWFATPLAAEPLWYNGHLYIRSEIQYHSFWEAQQAAVSQGAYLVTFDDENEWKAVSTEYNGENLWMGAYYTNGNFQWITGESSPYRNWDSSFTEPDLNVEATNGVVMNWMSEELQAKIKRMDNVDRSLLTQAQNDALDARYDAIYSSLGPWNVVSVPITDLGVYGYYAIFETPVPTPDGASTIALLGMALVALGWKYRRF